MAARAHRRRLLEKALLLFGGRINKIEKLSQRFAYYRLAIFTLAFIMTIVFVATNQALILPWLLLSAVVFAIFAYQHNRIDTSLQRHRIRQSMLQDQLARISLDWDKMPPARHQRSEFDHPFEIDLDITGAQSLHRLLDLTISREGSAKLAQWLLVRRPDAKAIRSRQPVVRELAALPGFCDNLLLRFKMVSEEQFEGQLLLNWVQMPSPVNNLHWLLPLSSGLAILNIILLFATLLQMVNPMVLISSLVLYGLIYYFNQNSVQHLFNDALKLEKDLARITALLTFLEEYPYHKCPNLSRFCSVFIGDSHEERKKPSLILRNIKWVSAAIGLRMNPLMMILLNGPGPWDYVVARRLGNVKAQLAERLKEWIPLWSELEGMIALANLARLNPEYSFPVIKAAGGNNHQKTADIYVVKGLGHPLLDAREKIRNDFSFTSAGQTLLITGSNMAGKSTFLKAMGVNLCLAYAGGPVDALFMQTKLFRLFSSIKVSDSVTDGFSYFYAEVRRLKSLLNALQEKDSQPLFFLIDEIFRGTNNRERFIGSRSYIKSLVGGNGVGAISTHDLELTRLSDELPLLHNYHFREEVVDGQMKFDYQLRSGPCPTTNALVIMELEGLPVEQNEASRPE